MKWLRWLALLPALAFGGQAQLTWDAPQSNVDGSNLTNLAGYQVYRRCDSNPLMVVRTELAPNLDPLPGEQAGWTDVGIPDDGRTCWYSVTAFNTLAEESVRTGEVSKTFNAPPPAVAPAAPQNVQVTWVSDPPPPPPVAPMTSHVGFARNTNPSSTSVSSLATSTSIAVNAGDLLVVSVFGEGADTTLSATDNASGGSNTYTGLTKRRNTANGDMGGQLFWAIAKASETLTFTANWASARPWNKVHAWVARPTSGYTFALDVENTAEFSSTGDLTLALSGVAGGAAYAVTALAEYFDPFQLWTAAEAGWTADYNRGDNSGGNREYAAHKVLTTETAIDGGASTASNSGDGLTLNAVFKEVADAAVVTPSKPVNINRAVARAAYH